MLTAFNNVLYDLSTEHERIETLRKKGDFIPPSGFRNGENFGTIERTRDGRIKKNIYLRHRDFIFFANNVEQRFCIALSVRTCFFMLTKMRQLNKVYFKFHAK